MLHELTNAEVSLLRLLSPHQAELVLSQVEDQGGGCVKIKVRRITSWIRRRPDNLPAQEQFELKEVRAAVCPG